MAPYAKAAAIGLDGDKAFKLAQRLGTSLCARGIVCFRKLVRGSCIR
jgi:hypothetical protein